MKISTFIIIIFLTAVLSACGGGDSPIPPEKAVQTLRIQASAIRLANVSTTNAATQLMDFAESALPTIFPGHQNNIIASGYVFRYYSATGAYIAIMLSTVGPYIEGNVYVVGPPFGNTLANPLDVGPITKYITVSNASDSTTVPAVVQGNVYIQEFPFGAFNLVNLSTGAITPQTSVSCGGISSATVGIDGVAIGSLSDGRVVKFDPVSGRCDPLFTAPEWLSTIAYSPSGNLVAQSQANFFGAKQIYTFSPTGNQISKVPLSGASTISGLAFGSDGVAYGPGFIGWFALSPSSGVATKKATVTNIPNSKICVDQTGVAYGESFGILYRYDLKTGAPIGQLTLERDLGGAIVCR